MTLPADCMDRQGEFGAPDEPLGQSLLLPHPVLDGVSVPDSERPVSFTASGSHTHYMLLPPTTVALGIPFYTQERRVGLRKAASDWATSHGKTTGSVTPPRTSDCETGLANSHREGIGFLFWSTRLWTPEGKPGACHFWSVACRDGSLVCSKKLGKA